MNPLDIGLPKWPALIVRGTPVTREQAAEIIVRTSGLHFFSNDHAFVRQLYTAAEIGYDDGSWPNRQDLDRARERYGVLDLDYLRNSRIVSAWIGGPHGWCDWSGAIVSSNYNIGKWPSVESVAEEWQIIAAAFPFLSLRAQLLSGETCKGEDTAPLVEFVVREGTTEVCAPAELLSTPIQVDLSGLFLRAAGRERGCTLDTFRWALSITEAAMRARITT